MSRTARRLSSLWQQQEGRCFYCQLPLPLHLATVDHLIPRAEGGSDLPDNRVACCRAINNFFGAMSFDLKVLLKADQQFMAGITRWCLIASSGPNLAAAQPHAPTRAGAAAAGGEHSCTALHLHCDDPPQDMRKGESSALFLTE